MLSGLYVKWWWWIGGANQPLLRDELDSTEIQQSGHTSRSGPEIKDEKRSVGEDQMRNNPEGKLEPAVDDCRAGAARRILLPLHPA